MSHPDVHIGRDGWLFLVGGRNRAATQYRRNPAWWWRLRRWRQIIEARAAGCERLGVRFLQVVAPEKLTIMPDRCAKKLVDASLSPAVRLAKLMVVSPAASSYVDLVEPLRLRAGSEDLFFRTDTHWNYEGCFVAYAQVCSALGVAPRHDLLERPSQEFEQPMNLGGKFKPPLPERFRLHGTMQDSRRTWVNDTASNFFAKRGKASVRASQAVYDNASPSADPRHVLIFGDSFSHFDPILLTGMLAETFRRVHFVWSSSLDWPFVERVAPDILVCEIAERFLKRIPNDKFDVEGIGAAHLREHSGASGIAKQ